MTPYHQLVSDYARLLKQGRTFPLGTFKPAPRPEIPANAPKALFFAPHPDDECIVGAMAVRLMRQARMNLVNVAVTLGSKKERQAGRLGELQAACNYLGFTLVTTAPCGLEKITPKTREQDPGYWATCVKVIKNILEQHQPKVVLCPHDRDWNGTHIGTHYLVMDALKQMPASYTCYLVETEFWGAMSDPNLMVEVSAEDLADMMAATSFHVGEVNRNPYHLLLPPWMMDNVRRGGEVVGGQGGAAPDYTFAVLYRLRKWSQGQAVKFYEGGKQAPLSMNVADLFA
ncbi:MAG TPA: PIG-L family deacetylase [Verrucomicrobiota bacterium]|jgi:LmbE family N-acetylglucosaminyl deacetylase|nr:PIG-L family deacetylase [Verrucomicrobiota bacterium]HQL79217.1 PIG-L family deacetylase [Verrucomicrobiota bacterium]